MRAGTQLLSRAGGAEHVISRGLGGWTAKGFYGEPYPRPAGCGDSMMDSGPENGYPEAGPWDMGGLAQLAAESLPRARRKGTLS